MVPDLSLRIEAIKRALQNTIFPLLPVEHKNASEQSQLILASLDMLSAQLPFFHVMEVVELESLVALVAELLAIADAGSDQPRQTLLTQCREAVQNPRTVTSELQDRIRELRELVHTLTEEAAAQPGPVFDRVAAVIVQFEEEHLQRERSWVAAVGFDVYPESLLSIPEALGLHLVKTSVEQQGGCHDPGQ